MAAASISFGHRLPQRHVHPFGRARDETAPARPAEIACVASGVVAKRCSASAAGSARPEAQRPRVPQLDDRRPADVEPHERRAAHLVDDRVRQRQPTPSPAAAAAIAAAWLLRCATRAGRSRCARYEPGAVEGRAPAGRRASARPRSAPARHRAARQRCPGAATTIAGSAGTAPTRRRRAGSRVGPSATSARRCSSISANDAPGTRLDRDLQPLVAGRERVDQRPDVLGHQARWRPPAAGAAGRGFVHRAPRLLGQPEDLGRQRGQPPPARRQRDAAALARRTARRRAPCAARATATDTAGSVTSSSAAAALTDPRRATRTKDWSCARVIGDRGLSDRLVWLTRRP